MFDTVGTVSATITNTGSVTAAEVAQLYIGLPAGSPEAPPRQLRGFNKLSLAPGESGNVTFSLRKRDLSYWDTVSQNWIVPSGVFAVNVTASSRDFRLAGKIAVL